MESWRYKRDKWLVRQGFVNDTGHASYSAYTRSSHWRKFRKRYFEVHPVRCHVCERTGEKMVLHHLSYKRIGAERFSDVIPMCKMCHSLAHDKATTGIYIFKGSIPALKKIYAAEGLSELDRLYEAYWDRTNRRSRVRATARKRYLHGQSGPVVVRQLEQLSDDERTKYGFAPRSRIIDGWWEVV
jgi:hypothetical protein